MRFSTVAKLHAEHMARVINDRLGWRGAQPEHVHKLGYTGRVIMSPRAAEEIAVRLMAVPDLLSQAAEGIMQREATREFQVTMLSRREREGCRGGRGRRTARG